jgi:D-erythronate 2-dehydrogenase
MNTRHIVVTGAGGFIGERLATQLISEPAYADARFTLTDCVISRSSPQANVRLIQGDVCDKALIAEVLGSRADIVYHLAGVLGGAAEINYPLARRVNLDASLNLLESLRDESRPPRVVYASSIAVFGPPLPSMIDDDTIPQPVMHYGGQKRMIEVAIEQLSAHGWIDGIALRLPGIVARPAADARLKSAFLNTMFYDYASGRDFTLPVSPRGTVWLISVSACVRALVHAGQLPQSQMTGRRALTLPAQRISMLELVSGLGERFPQSQSRITWAPDPGLEALFACQPPLMTAMGDALGFKHDGSLVQLINNAVQ